MDEKIITTPTVSAITTSQTIGGLVSAQIADASKSTRIIDSVVKELVNTEIERRADALLKAINLATTTRRELYKIKPDIVSYNADRSINSEAWSKAKLDERQKLTEKLDKIDKVISKAVDKGDYADVLSLE